MKRKNIVLVTALITGVTLSAFAPEVDFSLDHSYHSLPNEKDRDDAKKDSKDDGAASYRDDFGNDHTYINGEEFH